MSIELTIKDYEELHKNILKEAIKGKDRRNPVLDFKYYREVCFLVFDWKGNLKRVQLNHGKYVSDAEFKRDQEMRLSTSSHMAKMAKRDADAVRWAQMGERESMSQVGITDKDLPFKRH